VCVNGYERCVLWTCVIFSVRKSCACVNYVYVGRLPQVDATFLRKLSNTCTRLQTRSTPFPYTTHTRSRASQLSFFLAATPCVCSTVFQISSTTSLPQPQRNTRYRTTTHALITNSTILAADFRGNICWISSSCFGCALCERWVTTVNKCLWIRDDCGQWMRCLFMIDEKWQLLYECACVCMYVHIMRVWVCCVFCCESDLSFNGNSSATAVPETRFV
jgi:hypothetical protein